MLEYLRHYPDTQLDSSGKVRKVWLFEFKIHREPLVWPLACDTALSSEILHASRLRAVSTIEDDEIVDRRDQQKPENIERIEHVRRKLLAMEPETFECFVKDLLVHCGFLDVCVTK